MKLLDTIHISSALAAMAVAYGCAAATTGGRDRGADPNLITRSELSRTVASNAFEAIQRLRPQWLRPRGPSSVSQPEGDWPVVYMDNVRAGDVNVLATIALDDIGQIRFISGRDATTRWGTGVTGGVIEIVSLRRRN